MDSNYKLKLLRELIGIAEELGWGVAFAGEEDEEVVEGLVIGTPAYIDEILGVDEFTDAMEELSMEDDTDAEEVQPTKPEKKRTFH